MAVLPILQALVLLTLANVTPVIVKKISGSHMAWPIDAGMQFRDGQPLFGPSKTVRGVVSSIVVTAALSPLLGVNAAAGGLVAAIAMAGDLFSSFVKRRLKFPPSTQAIGLDQIPESLFPLLACQSLLSLALTDIALCVIIFLISELVVSRLLYRLRVRDQPY
jgi:CDP-2,3-bis-(O-geranylgeranyl)-sn-glycerol synthase